MATFSAKTVPWNFYGWHPLCLISLQPC